MENVRVWKWLVLLLTILNVALMVMLLKGPPQPPMMPHPEHEDKMRPAERLMQELKFNPDQVKSFELLRNEHHEAIQLLQTQGRELRDTFFEMLKQDQPDSAAVNNKVAAIGANQMAIEKVTFDHFAKVRALGDAEQKKHFDGIIHDLLRMMAGPHRGMHGPPPPQHPHDSPH